MIERDKEYYNQKIGELYSVIDNQEKIIRDLQEENHRFKASIIRLNLFINEGRFALASKYIKEVMKGDKNE